MNPCSKSILSYIPLCDIANKMENWWYDVWVTKLNVLFYPKGHQLQSQSCGVESGNLTYWFRVDENTSPLTFPLHYLLWYLINWGEYSAGVTSEAKSEFLSFLSWITNQTAWVYFSRVTRSLGCMLNYNDCNNKIIKADIQRWIHLHSPETFYEYWLTD